MFLSKVNIRRLAARLEHCPVEQASHSTGQPCEVMSQELHRPSPGGVTNPTPRGREINHRTGEVSNSGLRSKEWDRTPGDHPSNAALPWFVIRAAPGKTL